MQLRAAIRCLYLQSTSQCPLCLSASCYHHHDDGERLHSAAMWVWYLLSHHDYHHGNINDTQSLSGPVLVSLEYCGIRLATDRQFVWVMWLYRSTDGNGHE